jgi:hypothetical protein
MKKSILVIIYLFISIVAFSQKRKAEKIPRLKTPNIKVAYLGNSHPGIKLGAEFNFRNKQITAKRKNGKTYVSTKQSFLTANFIAYEHYTFKNNIMFNIEWLKRKTFQNSLFVDGSIGLGLSKGINKEPKTYKQQDDGSLKIIKSDNRYLVVSLSGGGGYDLFKKTGKPIKVYAKGGLYSILYHQFPYFMVTAEVGVVAPLSIFRRK